jgi:hypothetical protein
MKSFLNKELTSNETINKVLLLTNKCDEKVFVNEKGNRLSIIECLEREYKNQRITSKECEEILLNFTDVYQRLYEIDVTLAFLLVCMECFIDDLAKHPNWRVRREVALAGFHLDLLVNDEASLIRNVVAKHGVYLDFLAKDKSNLVRSTVEKMRRSHT